MAYIILKWNSDLYEKEKLESSPASTSARGQAFDLYNNISNGYYPTNKLTLESFMFFNKNKEEDDWILFEAYKEIFNAITIFLHRKCMINIKSINIPNILQHAIDNNLIESLFKFIYNEVITYKKYPLKNLGIFINNHSSM